MLRLYLLSLLCFLLPACKRIKLEECKQSFINNAQASLGYKAIIPTFNLDRGISRDEAVTIGLTNSIELEQDFASLGAAKADFIQAGLFTNPDIGAFLKFRIKALVTQIDISLAFALNDLWQIPLKKEVFKDYYEIAALKIHRSIKSIATAITLAYDNAVFLTETLKVLHDNCYDNSQDNKVEIIKIEGAKEKAYAELASLLGMHPSAKITLTDALDCDYTALPPIDLLERWALEGKPEIQIGYATVKVYRDLLLLEEGQRVKSAGIGTTFERDLTNDIGMGPDFRMQVPIFDQNQAQILKAEYLLKKAESELALLQAKVKKDIFITVSLLNMLERQIQSYAIAQVEQKNSNEIIKILLNLKFEYAKGVTELESIVGKRLPRSNAINYSI